jgi:hypothetical protein
MATAEQYAQCMNQCIQDAADAEERLRHRRGGNRSEFWDSLSRRRCAASAVVPPLAGAERFAAASDMLRQRGGVGVATAATAATAVLGCSTTATPQSAFGGSFTVLCVLHRRINSFGMSPERI